MILRVRTEGHGKQPPRLPEMARHDLSRFNLRVPGTRGPITVRS